MKRFSIIIQDDGYTNVDKTYIHYYDIKTILEALKLNKLPYNVTILEIKELKDE